jgi:hypothetical protein
MTGLRTVSAIFAASARFDTEQAAALNLFAAPMLQMNSAALRNQIEQRLMIEAVQLIKRHRAATLDETLRAENQKE